MRVRACDAVPARDEAGVARPPRGAAVSAPGSRSGRCCRRKAHKPRTSRPQRRSRSRTPRRSASARSPPAGPPHPAAVAARARDRRGRDGQLLPPMAHPGSRAAPEPQRPARPAGAGVRRDPARPAPPQRWEWARAGRPTKSQIVKSISCPTAEMTGSRRRDGAGDDLFVELPQIFDAAAASRHDDDIHGERRSLDQAIQLRHRRGDLRRRPSPCTRTGLISTRTHGARRSRIFSMSRKRRAGRRSDDADAHGKARQRPLARGIEEPLRLELALERLEFRLQQPAPAGCTVWTLS